MDETLEAPVLETGIDDEKNNIKKKYYTECFVNNEGLIKNDYLSRLYSYKKVGSPSENTISQKAYAGICPDFMLN